LTAVDALPADHLEPLLHRRRVPRLLAREASVRRAGITEPDL